MIKKLVSESEIQLRSENEELRLRLTEAEETLYAIRNGEVDAIVVSDTGGARIFSLTSAETPYRIMVEEMHEGAATLMADTTILHCNSRFAKMVAHTTEQILGTRFSQFIGENEKTAFTRLFNSGLAGRSSGEITWLSPENEICYFHLSFSQLPPEVTGDVCVIVSDFTERKQAEETLHAHVFLNSVIENSPNALWILDKQGALNQMNQASRTLFSIHNDEVSGKYNILNDPVFQEQGFMPMINDVFEKGSIIRFVARYDAASIKGIEAAEILKLDLDVSISPILDPHGKVTNAVVQFIDITEQKQAELELLAAKDHAEQSDRLKSAFLANMSHEIRTPMNGILGFSELLQEPGLTGEKQQEYIKIIQKSGNRMLNIINDIIDISKIEANLMNVELKDSNINEKIEFIYFFFKPQVEEKGMTLLFKSTLPAKEATIRTDDIKVYSILTNLVKNAIKYSKKGVIEFGYEVVETSQNLSLLQFYVKDTGIGIPKDRQSAIFERFIQADISDKMARQGAGLGLSISKAYVEMLGGKIWVESEEGIGSTFYFTLPYNAELAKGTIDQHLAPSGKTDNVRKLKILVAEDDEISEMMIDIMVKTFGEEILKAKTGVEAVNACLDNPDIDLILMDIQMPEMGGYEATRQIRQFNKEIVIIAQTAFGLSGDREKAIEAGCNDYIAKPIKKKELIEVINRQINRRAN